MNTDNTPISTNPKKRSRLYPRYGLEEVVSFIKVVDEVGGNSVMPDIVAGKMGKSQTNSSFTGRLSAAKQFGLVAPENSKIVLTDLAQRILYPTPGGNDPIVEAFSTPPFYAELIANYRGKKIPDRDTLGNVVKQAHGIEAAARNSAASNFINSAEYAGLVKNGILVMSLENNSYQPMDEEVVENNSGEVSDDKPLPPPANDYNLSATKIADGSIVLYLPAELKDKQYLDDDLNDKLRSVVKDLTAIANEYIIKNDNDQSV